VTLSPQQDRLIALLAVFQSVALVKQVAETGQVDRSALITMLDSLLLKDAPDSQSIYGGVAALHIGREQLKQQFSKKRDAKDVSTLRYVISLLHLERKLAKQKTMLNPIREDMAQLPQHIDYFGSIDSPQVIARMADTYHRTISQLSPRIQVVGDPSILQQADNVNRVRALLLSGIRAAVLWRQKGGRRWQILFQSQKLLQLADELS
jgi:high frequency lysogenization protein